MTCRLRPTALTNCATGPFWA